MQTICTTLAFRIFLRFQFTTQIYISIYLYLSISIYIYFFLHFRIKNIYFVYFYLTNLRSFHVCCWHTNTHTHLPKTLALAKGGKSSDCPKRFRCICQRSWWSFLKSLYLFHTVIYWEQFRQIKTAQQWLSISNSLQCSLKSAMLCTVFQTLFPVV